MASYLSLNGHISSHFHNQKSKVKVLPVKATAGGWFTGSSACLTFLLHSLMSSAKQEGSEYYF